MNYVETKKKLDPSKKDSGYVYVTVWSHCLTHSPLNLNPN